MMNENEKLSLQNKLVVFQNKEIRRAWHNDEWWYVVTDVVASLTDSVNPSDYLKKLRKRDETVAELFKGGGQFVPPPLDYLLKLPVENKN